MTWVDLVVIGLLLLSGLLAFVRGFVREVLGIGAWAGALAAGLYGLPLMRPYAQRYIATPTYADAAAFLATFIVSLIVLMIIAWMIGSLVRNSVLGGVDRTLGLVFGLVRGAVIVVIAYILAGMVFPIDRWPPVVLEARSIGPVYEGAVWARAQLPEEYRPRIYAPPSVTPGLNDLMQPVPQGRATGQLPVRD
ncbi:CvpA family protein [Rhodopila sp.]|jgi:membrane protein required for colicin V production|uniref:CvpA family protein n=1 Tax=Rhodopila sp. TaxID=2480087 RepID=UPI002BA529DE|nr:CvpA family protein [Rhodopila sp.]HVZ07966.1 CvpA family protein [Rhodopila sp.]